MLQNCRIIFLPLLAFFFIYSVSAQTVWQERDSGTDGDLIAVCFSSSDKGWIAGDNGFLASTTDGGKTWERVPLSTTDNINEIYFRNARNGYLVAGRKMFLTEDAGETWREVLLYDQRDFPGLTPEFLSIRFAGKKLGLVVGSVLNKNDDVVDSLVLRTEDGGKTWQRVIVPSKTELFHLDFVGDSRVWVVGDRGIILRSTDGGVTWQKQVSGTQRALYNVDFRDSELGFAVGGRGTVLRTEDGGLNWEPITTNFPTNFMRVDFADDKNGWIVGHKGTILRSGDKGRSWIKQESGTKANLFGLYIMKRFGWAVGAEGLLLQHIK